MTKRLKTITAFLKLHDIKVLGITAGDEDSDAEIKLEHGMHVQVGHGYLMLVHVTGESSEQAWRFGPERRTPSEIVCTDIPAFLESMNSK